jgi:DUF4097 and DUF4098 domain-containing protein YvlB
MTNTTLQRLALAVTSLSLTGCDGIGFGDMERYREDFRYTRALQSGGKLSVENFNGAVEIAGWEKSEVEINGTKYANTKERLDEIRIDVQTSGNAVSIRTLRPAGRWGNGGARFTIRVPRSVDLDTVNTTNGSIRVENIEGRGILKSSNGAIRALRMKGELNASTSNGSIEMNELEGNAWVRTANGAIRGEIAKGSLDAKTSNGSIQVKLRDPGADKPVRAESKNGSIDLTLGVPREVRASTSNSSVTVRLPAGTNANLRARTSNASITCDFDVTAKGGRISRNSVEGSIGSGGPLIDLETTNGGIKILKQ